jgi:hypothetical protein
MVLCALYGSISLFFFLAEGDAVVEGLGFYNINYCVTARPKTGDEKRKKRLGRKFGQAQHATQDTPVQARI